MYICESICKQTTFKDKNFSFNKPKFFIYFTYSFKVYIFSAEMSCSSSLLATLFSAASTTPSFAKMPIAVPA